MMVRYALMLALLGVFVAGCEKSPSDQMKDRVGEVKEKVKETSQNVWSGSVKAIDKAKDVGKTLMDSADEQRRKIEKESE